MESWRAILRAWLCRSGLAAMREDTEEALAGLAPGSYWRASALALQGLSHLLEDDADCADQLFSQAVDVGVRFGRLPAAAAALSERALLALGRHDDAEARDLIRRAGALVDDGYLHDYPITALYAAAAARVALRDGDVGRARTHAAHASRLRVGLTAALPHLAVQARLELVRAYLELSDAAGARLLLREVRDVVQLRPDLGTLPAAADALRDKLAAMGPGSVGVTSLTTAELRLLPLLPTHLTFREMGERLHVSRHTIKTQAMSVYRKLGVSSRSEAIERVHAVGLLDD
jgi:LuxR family maltose regulon positive regulatory protein